MDAAPPPASPPHDPPPYVYAPSDIYPVGDRERELCAKADHPDWLYLGVLFALDAGSFFANAKLTGASSEGARLIGPSFIGFSFGATIGGGYLALPKCDPHWVTYSPREGEVRATWPLALTLAMVGGVFGTSMAAVSTTNVANPEEVQSWTTGERSLRLWLAGGAGVIGALLPYVLPPQTWRASRELAHIRATADQHGARLTYTITF